MSYNASWSNGTSGVLIPGVHSPMLSDISEIADAINRRRLLMGLAAQDFSSGLSSVGSYVSNLALATAVAPPYYNFRTNIIYCLLNNSSPWMFKWLWPFADADQNKPILPAPAPVPPGYVSLYDKLNGTAFWTDGNLTTGVTPVRAVHVNELRQAISFLIRYSTWDNWNIIYNLNSPPN